MLEVILQILSIIGIVLLVLLCIVLVILLLVLFFPITYRFSGSKSEDIVAVFRAKWLFGFLRVKYEYPETATLSVKVLWHTLFQKKLPPDEADKTSDTETVAATEPEIVELPKEPVSTGSQSTEKELTESVPETGTGNDILTSEGTKTEEAMTEETGDSDEGFFGKILQKIEKIKYTIRNIYDKIKEIWKNISYYVELLKEDSTKALFQHVTTRFGKILRSIRPRHVKADILFGTGSPDTTGYAYGAYGILSGILGPKFVVTPDFEQAVFRGELQFSGHITIWVLLINALKLLIDPKLHLFIKKVKAGMPQKDKK